MTNEQRDRLEAQAHAQAEAHFVKLAAINAERLRLHQAARTDEADEGQLAFAVSLGRVTRSAALAHILRRGEA